MEQQLDRKSPWAKDFFFTDPKKAAEVQAIPVVLFDTEGAKQISSRLKVAHIPEVTPGGLLDYSMPWRFDYANYEECLKEGGEVLEAYKRTWMSKKAMGFVPSSYRAPGLKHPYPGEFPVVSPVAEDKTLSSLTKGNSDGNTWKAHPYINSEDLDRELGRAFKDSYRMLNALPFPRGFLSIGGVDVAEKVGVACEISINRAPKPITPTKSLMSQLTAKFRVLTRQQPEKSLIARNLENEDGTVTREGIDTLNQYLWDKFRKEVYEAMVKPLDEEDEKSRK